MTFVMIDITIVHRWFVHSIYNEDAQNIIIIHREIEKRQCSCDAGG